jgi:hypothetical protein
MNTERNRRDLSSINVERFKLWFEENTGEKDIAVSLSITASIKFGLILMIIYLSSDRLAQVYERLLEIPGF